MTRNELIDLIARQTNEYRAQLESYLPLCDKYLQLTNEQNELRYALANEHSERERIKIGRLIFAIDSEKRDLSQATWNKSRLVQELLNRHHAERDNAIEFDPPF